MTAKEKAEELYVGFWHLTNDSRIAKQCALIAVDEMVEWSKQFLNEELLTHALLYLEEVKQEIQKL